jgi:hypothetical protein
MSAEILSSRLLTHEVQPSRPKKRALWPAGAISSGPGRSCFCPPSSFDMFGAMEEYTPSDPEKPEQTSPTASRRGFLPVPAASRRTHLLAAGLLWSLVGIMLAATGVVWTLRSRTPWAPLLLVLAAGLGWGKARWILGRTAERTIRRIESRGDGRCLGGFLSWKSWLVVAAMIGLGRWLRRSSLPLSVRGVTYSAIGLALFLASLRIWAHRAGRVDK